MNLFSLQRLAACVLPLLLAACGGGGGDGDSSVATLSAANVGYGKTTTLTVNGSKLNAGLTAAIEPGCLTMAPTTASSTSATFTCRITAVGDLRVRVRTAEGAELATLRLDVPVPQVRITAKQGNTTGSFVVELDPAKAPNTVLNFLSYVNSSSTSFYVNTLFHKIVPGSAMYAGTYNTGPALKTNSRSPVALEANNGLKNLRGTIAMFHGSNPDSATSQFFINLVDNPAFDYVDAANPGYAVFGSVIVGLTETVDLIATVPTTTKTATIGGVATTFENIPSTNVTISAILQIR
ncbi:peptidylprolyl isomerase [Aquabacterium sp.]|uniref:peptidylprolyl isomerase n=1 Tax=Aquabacterium sp. TaxID=1872578 RepID=UPI002BFBCFEC|nr:peptidylprolyl isomerase [Aquabacterium sp.]HSW05891.1 peptidylprolyl isomerase [Aquabacterium sp.]